MRQAPPQPACPRGFTLLEMLVVLVLVAAGSALALAAFGGGLRGARLHDAARELAAQLRFTRALAIRSGRAQDFVIDPRTRHWQVAGQRQGELADAGTLVFTGASAEALGRAPADAGTGVVRFFPDGAASGGRVQLLAGGAGWEVEVAWLTGEVRLQRAQAAP